MEEEKKFELLPDGSLKIEIDTSDVLNITKDGKYHKIGKYEQKTFQYIEKDQIVELKNFISAQAGQIAKQLDGARAQLKQLENVNEETLPEKMIADVQKYIANSKNKRLKLELKNLSTLIGQIQMKKQLKGKVTFMEKQFKMISAELNRFKSLDL